MSAMMKVAIVAAFVLAAAAAAAPIDESSAALEQRLVPNPSLRANMVFRVLFAIIGTILCWVPFRLLWRNGDIAAVVLIADVALINLFTVLNSLIWNSDNWDAWWDGAGLCDIEVYLWRPQQTVYAACIFAIIRQLANQVKLVPTTRPTRRERTRNALVQAAIIVPIPVFQLIFTWFDLAQRYNIGTLIGCLAMFDNSWPRIVVYDVPNAVFVVASVPFAVLTWKRYRAISKSTREALKGNSAASARANRTRFRLYNMSLSILVVYLPVSIYFLVYSIQESLASEYVTYNYQRIHWEASPYPWGSILFMPSWDISTVQMNQPWIAIATTVVLVAFFGTTIDGLDMYRRYAVALGLARCFPRLGKADDPDDGPHRPADSDDSPRSWIALDNLGKNRGETAGTRRFRHADPYPIPPDSGKYFDPDNLLPKRAPPLSPLQLEPPTQLAMSDVYNNKISSPLERVVIEPFIPPRSSSILQYQQYPSALHAPANELPHISLTLFPHLQKSGKFGNYAGPNAYTAAGRSLTRPRSESNNSESTPILASRAPNPAVSGAESANDSPTSLNFSIHGKSSHDAVRPREMLGARDSWNEVSPGPAHWPFLPGTALTSSTPIQAERPTLVAGGGGSHRSATRAAGEVQMTGPRLPVMVGTTAVPRGRGRAVSRSAAAKAQSATFCDANEGSAQGTNGGTGQP
ncbi:pheromone A receptor-domain-containing protein [Hypoxylon crocopeplum]|nr:pheromone A receptor-domain-containing protein [Hypoxylon crocopeplum]